MSYYRMVSLAIDVRLDGTIIPVIIGANVPMVPISKDADHKKLSEVVQM